jgi:hypothetical protein
MCLAGELPRTRAAVREHPLRHDARMRKGEQDDFPDYRDCHATVVDAIRYVTTGQSLEDAADEALTRLRTLGLPIPPWVPPSPE